MIFSFLFQSISFISVLLFRGPGAGAGMLVGRAGVLGDLGLVLSCWWEGLGPRVTSCEPMGVPGQLAMGPG